MRQVSRLESALVSKESDLQAREEAFKEKQRILTEGHSLELKHMQEKWDLEKKSLEQAQGATNETLDRERELKKSLEADLMCRKEETRYLASFPIT